MLIRLKRIIAAATVFSSVASPARETVHMIDRLIAHISTVPAIAGKEIDLFVREKIPASIIESPATSSA